MPAPRATQFWLLGKSGRFRRSVQAAVARAGIANPTLRSVMVRSPGCKDRPNRTGLANIIGLEDCLSASCTAGLLAMGAPKLNTQNFDRNDRDCLVSENSLVSLDLAGDIGVLDHSGESEILDPARQRGGQRLLQRIE